MKSVKKKRPRAGRPPKFKEARRPVTLTLPERTLRQLASIDPDRARAIVKTVDAIMATSAPSTPLQVLPVTDSSALIVTGPCQALKRIPFLRMLEIAPARFILSLQTGTSTESLEVVLGDILDNLPPTLIHEKPILEDFVALLKNQRRTSRVSKEEIVFVDPAMARR